jgi:hypothetical protein
VINALLIFATAAIGFGGSPWAAFAIGAAAILVLGVPQHRDVLKRYAGHPKTDVIFGMVFEAGLAIAAALASAWTGYGLRLLLQALKG